jgi:hypothetical protein
MTNAMLVVGVGVCGERDPVFHYTLTGLAPDWPLLARFQPRPAHLCKKAVRDGMVTSKNVGMVAILLGIAVFGGCSVADERDGGVNGRPSTVAGMSTASRQKFPSHSILSKAWQAGIFLGKHSMRTVPPPKRSFA